MPRMRMKSVLTEYSVSAKAKHVVLSTVVDCALFQVAFFIW